MDVTTQRQFSKSGIGGSGCRSVAEPGQSAAGVLLMLRWTESTGAGMKLMPVHSPYERQRSGYTQLKSAALALQ